MLKVTKPTSVQVTMDKPWIKSKTAINVTTVAANLRKTSVCIVSEKKNPTSFCF